MALPTIPGTGLGSPATIFYHDGTEWVAVSKATFDDMLTALEKMDDLTDALDSEGADEIRVEARGGDKIFSYHETLYLKEVQVSINGSTYVYSDPVPSGEIWVITNIFAMHGDPTARILTIGLYMDGTNYELSQKAGAAQWDSLDRQGYFVLNEGDKVYATAASLGATHNVYLRATGFVMQI